MRIRHSIGEKDEKVELQMAPMIDIVFQLLAFFIMTLKIVTLEGDFFVTMPPPSREGPAADNTLLPLRVHLRANDAGQLTAIEFEGQRFGGFSELNHHIYNTVLGNQAGPESLADVAEVEIDADYQLQYQYTVGAVTAVSGYRTANGNIIKMIEKIKFTPPRRN
jgi:biopolymer transport protein ExbD